MEPDLLMAAFGFVNKNLRRHSLTGASMLWVDETYGIGRTSHSSYKGRSEKLLVPSQHSSFSL